MRLFKEPAKNEGKRYELLVLTIYVSSQFLLFLLGGRQAFIRLTRRCRARSHSPHSATHSRIFNENEAATASVAKDGEMAVKQRERSHETRERVAID